jgi:hypothetical protein
MASSARPREWSLGFNAWFNEGAGASNPYDPGTFSYRMWNEGYSHAKDYDATPSGFTPSRERVNLPMETPDSIVTDDEGDEYLVWNTDIAVFSTFNHDKETEY